MAELTEAGVQALIKRLRLRIQDLENINEGRQREILSLLNENARLRREVNSWIDDWVKVPLKSEAQKVDIHKA
jgi:hypothetical protein